MPPPQGESLRVGAGYVVLSRPTGLAPPSNGRGKATSPKVIDGFAQPITTNDWWSSLIWQFDQADEANPFSNVLHAHPMMHRAHADGLAFGHAAKPTVSAKHYSYPYSQDIRVGLDGLAAKDTRVVRYGDWTVTARWQDAAGSLDATIGHGLVFSYLTRRGDRPAVLHVPAGSTTVTGSVAIIDHDGKRWAAFAPPDATWQTESPTRVTSHLAGKPHFSVALLPDQMPRTLERFARHAFAFVTDSQVNWKYDARQARVISDYELQVEQLEGGDTAPLIALYRHQAMAVDAKMEGVSYPSARGEMSLLEAKRFRVTRVFDGVLPVLPLTDGVERDELVSAIQDAAHEPDLFPPGPEGKRDSYWDGKSLGRVAQLALMSEQVGDSEQAARFVQAVKNQLEDWFDGNEPALFYYDKQWNTLVGSPSGFFSDSQLNDHHFHYGYFVYAAAVVAHFDPDWAKATRYGAMVEQLIKDAANWDREDTRYPFLRAFDPYAGHSWANGPALFREGNNQESSSEDVNFSVGAILFGAATGKKQIRDLGVYLYTEQVSAIEQYWFDVDDAVFPKSFDPPTIGILWSDGGRYDTWWDPDPVYVHGINMLPFTGGSLYLTRHTDYMSRNYAALERNRGGTPRVWRDVALMQLAITDPALAAKRLAAKPYFKTEFGVSHAQLYHWIHNLKTLGTIHPSVRADSPTAVAFKNGQHTTYVAYNPTSARQTAKYSDGKQVQLRPRELRHVSTAVSKGAAK